MRIILNTIRLDCHNAMTETVNASKSTASECTEYWKSAVVDSNYQVRHGLISHNNHN